MRTSATEVCGVWNITSTYYDGCILKSYCDLDADYFGTDVKFKCINGETAKHDGPEHHTKVFDLSTYEYSITVDVPANTDLIIEGKENYLKPGYEWQIMESDCVDQISIGAVILNSKEMRRIFPFRSVPETIIGSKCSINFVFKPPYRKDPDSIRDVKKVYFNLV